MYLGTRENCSTENYRETEGGNDGRGENGTTTTTVVVYLGMAVLSRRKIFRLPRSP